MTVIDTGHDYDDGEEDVYDLETEKRNILEATEKIKQDLWERWKKRHGKTPVFPQSFAAIHPEALDFMLSFQTTNFYNELVKKFDLSGSQRDLIPQIVWKAISDKEFSRIASDIGGKLDLNQDISGQLAQSLEQNIFFKIQNMIQKPIIRKADSEEEQKKQLVSLALAPALKKYDKLGEQSLSGNPIKLKIFEKPVRPSIKNWIADYYEKVDARKHDSIERGNYLFHSENARRLTTGERQKVGTMLRALDEDAMITIDTEKQEMVFGGSEGIDSQGPVASIGQSVSADQKKGSVGFSSTHKFPSEMNRNLSPSGDKKQSQGSGGNVVDLRG